MKKRIVSIIIVALTLLCTGCHNKNDDRFQVTYEQRTDPSSFVYIITDKETGVNYLYYKHSLGGGLTKLEE